MVQSLFEYRLIPSESNPNHGRGFIEPYIGDKKQHGKNESELR